ncbi:MAG: redoxin family protein [bacterium]|nr:redoxin family protein [bacterium]
MRRLLSSLSLAILLGAAPHAAPSLAPVVAARDWIGPAIAASELRGRVVVLDVFTVDCINCRNVVPTLRALNAADRAKGLRIIGIHAPETPAEQQRRYVMENLRRQGITWPVALDNAFSLWKAYGVDAWPTQLFFDRHGRLRRVIVGDSQDDAVRATVEALLSET